MYKSIFRQLTMATKESSPLRSKFRGSLLGSLFGDCLGSPYEGDITSPGDRITIQKYFDKLQDPTLKAPFRSYTDDTAMMKSIAEFLIEKPEPDYKLLAKKFVDEYFEEPERGYGQNVVDVFVKLKNNKLVDVFQPASEQFFGTGSYGNGGAMRIAPVALYYHNNYKAMLQVAENTTKLTHTHVLGVNGAILQCIAIQQAFKIDSGDPIEPEKFLDELITKIKNVESSCEDEEISKAYQNKLQTVKHFLKKKYNDEYDDEVIFELGNGVSAYESVPTAIFCFLRAQTEIPMVQTENRFRRAVQYAITLGGDTDTIACMTGAIAGAHLGENSIESNTIRHCESYKYIMELADKLYDTHDAT